MSLTRVRVEWCSACQRNTQFVSGECVMSPWHLVPCPGTADRSCGRPIIGTTSCSDCDPEGSAGARVDAAMEARDDEREAVEW